MSKILITRSAEQGQRFVHDFCRLYGDENQSQFLFEPMFEIVQYPSTINFDDYDVFLATSQNVLFDNLPDKPIFYVGMDDVQTVEDLIFHIQKINFKGKYLYLRGVDIRHDLRGTLNKLGFDVEEAITYNAKACEELNFKVVEQIKANEVRAITFFSARTAKIFFKLSQEKDLTYSLKDIKVLSISSSVLECVHSDLYKDVRVARMPNARGMMDLIKEFTDERSD